MVTSSEHFPVEPSIVREFAQGLDQIVVVEKKRAFLENAVKSVLYGSAGAPAVHGKRWRDGTPLFSPFGELDADAVASGLRRCLAEAGVTDLAEPARPQPQASLMLPPRVPFFCSGARTTPPPRWRRARWSAPGSGATPWSC